MVLNAFMNGFKSNLFPVQSEIMRYSTLRRSKINASELNKIFMNKIRNNEKI